MDFAGVGLMGALGLTDRGQVRLRKPPTSLLASRAVSVLPVCPRLFSQVAA